MMLIGGSVGPVMSFDSTLARLISNNLALQRYPLQQELVLRTYQIWQICFYFGFTAGIVQYTLMVASMRRQ